MKREKESVVAALAAAMILKGKKKKPASIECDHQSRPKVRTLGPSQPQILGSRTLLAHQDAHLTTSVESKGVTLTHLEHRNMSRHVAPWSIVL